jgi:hypothetical protein
MRLDLGMGGGNTFDDRQEVWAALAPAKIQMLVFHGAHPCDCPRCGDDAEFAIILHERITRQRQSGCAPAFGGENRFGLE